MRDCRVTEEIKINQSPGRIMMTYVCRIALVLFFFTGCIPLLFSQAGEKWWLQSSLADSVDHWQLHASGRYSYSRMKGIISGSTNSGSLVLALRKGVFTNFSRFGLDKFDMNLKSSVNLNYVTKSSYFTDYINLDLSKIFLLEGGFIWERDDAALLQNRYTVYGGAGLNSSCFKKKLKLKSLVASGRIDQKYTVPVDEMDVIKKPYTAFYCVHDFEYAITPEAAIAGKVYYFTDVNELDRYRYGYYLNLTVGLWKHVSLVAGYNYKYDRELKLLGLIPDNSTQNIGIEVSL